MPFKKGDPNINRKGRLDGGGLRLTTLLRDKLEEIPEGKKEAYKDMFIKTLLHKALVEKNLQSLKLMINYVDGLPKQNLDITTDGHPIIQVAQEIIEKNDINTSPKGDS